MPKQTEQTPLKKGRASFQITGEARVTDYTFTLGHTYASGWQDNKMNLGVDCGAGNVVYADLSGGYFPENTTNLLYAHGYTEQDGKRRDDYTDQIQVDWASRFDEAVLDTLGGDCFIRVGIERDTNGSLLIKRFLSAYDAVAYLQEHLEEGTPLTIRGTLRYSGLGSTYVTKEIKSIFLSKAEPQQYAATFAQSILLTCDSLGKPDPQRGTIPLSAYVADYVGTVKIKEGAKVPIKQTVAFPVAFELLADAEQPENTAKLVKRFFKVAKKDAVTELTVYGILQEGAAQVAVNWDDIPDDIKELVAMGVLTEQDAKAKSAIGSATRERRMVILRPEITYTGEGESRRPTIAHDTTRYQLADLVFLPALLEQPGEAAPPSAQPDILSDEDAELLALLGG